MTNTDKLWIKKLYESAQSPLTDLNELILDLMVVIETAQETLQNINKASVQTSLEVLGTLNRG